MPKDKASKNPAIKYVCEVCGKNNTEIQMHLEDKGNGEWREVCENHIKKLKSSKRGGE